MSALVPGGDDHVPGAHDPGADLPQGLTEDQAQALTSRIEHHLDTIAENTDAVIELIEKAKAGNAHTVLGYATWTAYVSEKFGGHLGRLARAERVPLVQMLADLGMSTRAIGPVVGASKDTVSRDIRAGVSDETPAETAVSKPVVGIDGKTYTSRSARADRLKRRRSPLAELHKWLAEGEQVVTEVVLDVRYGHAAPALLDGGYRNLAVLLARLQSAAASSEVASLPSCPGCGQQMMLPGRDQCERCRLDQEPD